MDVSRQESETDLTDLQKYWNRFAEAYVTYFTKFTTVVQSNIIVHLQLATEQKLRILEVGAGSGNATRLLINELTTKNAKHAKECELIASDFSPDMVERLKLSIKDENQLKSITALSVDARKLPFADGSFDRYFAGLCIQLVPEYETCIQEAARVLADGGIAGFSVWGREKSCTFFSVPAKIFEEVLGSDMPKPAELGAPPSTKKPHSNFDCGRDPNALIDMCKRAGFSRAMFWYTQVCTFTGLDERQVPMFVDTNSARELFDKIRPAEVQAVRINQVKERLMQIGSTSSEPPIFEALCVIAVK